MTKAAKHYGMRLDNFVASPETRDYIEALAQALKSSVCIAKRGGAPGNGGTWARPKLAVFFALNRPNRRHKSAPCPIAGGVNPHPS